MAYAPAPEKPASTRTIALAAIIGIHVLLVLGLTNALAMKDLKLVESVLTVFSINEPRPPSTEPIRPEVELQQPVELEMLVPEVPVIALDAIEAPSASVLEEASAAVSSNALTYTTLRSPDAYYPPMSRQLGESGVAVVRVCVNRDGSRDGAPALQTTSGFPRLDQAAVKWATEALRFKPAVQGGSATHACQGFRVKFRLLTAKN
jgi:protein TonB